MKQKPLWHDDADKENRKRRRMHAFRINFYFFAVFLLFSILIVRLAFLQFVEGPGYAEEEKRLQRRPVVLTPIRGNILDIEGAPIAWTRSSHSLVYELQSGRLKIEEMKKEQVALAVRVADMLAKLSKPGETPLTAEEIHRRMDTGYNMDGTKSNKPMQYMFWQRRITTDLSKEKMAVLAEHRDELPGFEIIEESTRVYDPDTTAVQLVGYLRPFKGLASQTLGYLKVYNGKEEEYLSDEYIGFDGLEFLYQNELRGQTGRKIFPVNSKDQIVGRAEIDPPVKGENLFLTINKQVQQATEQAITDHLVTLQTSRDPYVSKGNQALAGYAVAMEVDTGRVMAMASMPDYDPNVWLAEKLPTEVWDTIKWFEPNGTIRDRQPSIADEKVRRLHPSSLLPLGSTIKPLTVLVGLNEKLFGVNETYYDSGELRYGKDNLAKITNSDGYANGNLTPARAIRVSSNTFMGSMIGLRLYNKYGKTPGEAINVWDRYMKSFGLGVSTGSGLPLEHEGILEYKNTKSSSDQNALVMGAFGQQARYTTLQLAQYAMMLGNQGKRYKPQFVDRIMTYDNQLVKTMEPELLDEVSLPQEYWNVLKEGMRSEVSGFEDFPYPFARKTGTSQQNVPGRSDPVDNAVFIAYAPLDKPKLAVAVVVPEGGFGRYGAAPIARKMFDAYDQYFGLDGVPKKGKE